MRFTIIFCLTLIKNEYGLLSQQNDWVGLLNQIHENDDHELTVIKFLYFWYFASCQNLVTGVAGSFIA